MQKEGPSVQPWYRHRWPWILMAGPFIVVVAGIVTAWLAIRSNDALVADDYYKQGLSINRTLERERRAEMLGLEVTLSAVPEANDATRLDVVLKARDAADLPTRIRMLLAHPTRGDLDRELLLDGQAGHYGGVVRALQATHWKVLIEDEARSWRVQESLTVETKDGGQR
ncbi:FixH family protein [Methyloversatilis thermotolerans]|uniref:FixH family protein n=1 Tax=Methyloversatilis thermotolerans TaxID=1346290 RepID=UPI000360EC8D|nr:FixH family protein [Methyloversatilis thermotolerans]